MTRRGPRVLTRKFCSINAGSTRAIEFSGLWVSVHNRPAQLIRVSSLE